MDNEFIHEPEVSDVEYLGLAECVVETKGGHPDGGKSFWGLVLKEISDYSSESPVYERVGWFSSNFWKASHSWSHVIIV